MRGTVPHDQGAIDVAKVALQYGKDAEVRTLAEGVVKAQEGEVILTRDRLGKTD